jgi:hypothetical protein
MCELGRGGCGHEGFEAASMWTFRGGGLWEKNFSWYYACALWLGWRCGCEGGGIGDGTGGEEGGCG